MKIAYQNFFCCTEHSPKKANVSRPIRHFQFWKSNFLALLFIASSILIGVGCENKFKSYRSSTYGFSLQIPSSWQKIENTDGAAAIFLSPKETSLDVYQENISIVVQPLQGVAVSLVEYTDQAVYQLTRTFEQFQIVNSAPTTLSGLAAHKFEYIITDRVKIKVTHIWTLKNKTAYQLNFGCDIDRCDEYMPTVTQMINSFELE